VSPIVRGEGLNSFGLSTGPRSSMTHEMLKNNATGKSSSGNGPAPLNDSAEDIARDIESVSRLDAVPALLQVVCDVTGMGFAAVARVTDNTWTACAVDDRIHFGLGSGGQLDVHTTLCIEAKARGEPIVIDHASLDPRYCNHHTPKRYNIESYVSVPIVLPDGRYFGNLCAIDPKPASVSNPRIVGMFEGFARLIGSQLHTELRHESERTALRDERTSGELRDQFIAILGHDLRNPLQAIFATSELLERRLTDTVHVNMAARIRASARRMSALIDDVLDFARARLGGGIGVDIQPVADIESALSNVVTELQDGKPDRRIQLDAAIDSPVECDASRTQQVLSNLISNALTHGSPESPVRVSVVTSDTDLIMRVWNDGTPIPAESMAKIFEPFWRQSSDAGRGGLGLGLHICSQIVRAHGGQLTVTSSATEGTEFTVRLPLRQV
jgi:signal transduction histidine kinase